MRRVGWIGAAVTASVAACVLAAAAAALTPSDPDATHPAYAALNLPAAWDITTGAPESTDAPRGGSGIGCGTSMSAPLVSGIVGLMRAQAPFAPAEEIEARLASSARAVP